MSRGSIRRPEGRRQGGSPAPQDGKAGAKYLFPIISLPLACVLISLVLPLAATIVDRIAVSAGTQVITDSEIEQRIRLTAFENSTPPSFDPQARKTAADRLIDQKLIEHEMDLGQYPRLSTSRRESLLSDYEKANFKSSGAAMDTALASYGLSRADLQTDLARQVDLLTFLSVRFRPAVQISDQDVTQYFQRNIRPKLPNTNAGIEEYRSQIETELTNQRADTDMEVWLKEQRRKTRIRYLEPELAP
jgi:hypothetical protein